MKKHPGRKPAVLRPPRLAGQIWPGMSAVEWERLKDYVLYVRDALDLSDWWINFNLVPLTNGNGAEISFTGNYRAAGLAFCREWNTRDPEENTLTTLHELVHIYFQPLDDVMRIDTAKIVSLDSITILSSAHRRAEEFAVDAIARVIREVSSIKEWKR